MLNIIRRGYLATFRFCTKKQEAEIINILKTVKLDDGSDIYTKGYVQRINIQENNISIELKLTQDYRKVRALSQDSIQKLSWVKGVDIKMAPKEPTSEAKPFKRGNFAQVNKIIAVSSCKGGVGKSTVALNLAFSLQKLGKKIGIFDGDIYGPSLPTLLAKEKEVLQAPEDRPKEILPVEFEGVKTMSYGYLGGKKAVIRGPMVSSLVTQLAYQTIWGELDYLVVQNLLIKYEIQRDMPPGTGDIQITLCQELKFDAAVIVTTPQRLSFVDVVKGIEMFDVLHVPTVAVVENMSEFLCEECGHAHRPFGPGYVNMLKNQFGIKNSYRIPILADISKYSDLGSPVVLTLPDSHPVTRIYNDLAKDVDREIHASLVQAPPHVRYETGTKQVIVRDPSGQEKKINAQVLRKMCNCAGCVDEWSGKNLIQPDKISEDVYPYKIEPKGNYAVAIIWSDGHKSSIYPYDRLKSVEIPSDEDKKTA